MQKFKMAPIWLFMTVMIIFIAVIPFCGTVSAASEILTCKVFKNYTGEGQGDWMVVFVYNTDIEECDLDDYLWWVELIDDDTSQVVNQQPLRQCGVKPGCLAFDAETVGPMTWQGNYSVKIWQPCSSPPCPSATWDLAPNDWQGTMGWFDTYIINCAKLISVTEDINGSELLYVDPTTSGLTINLAGEYMFTTGIDGIKGLYPSLFSISEQNVVPDFIAPAGNHSYEEELASKWAESLGPEISGLWIDVGDYFNLSGRVIGCIMIGIGFLCLATYTKTIAFGILLGGVIIGVFPMAILIITTALLVLIFIRAFFLSST